MDTTTTAQIHTEPGTHSSSDLFNKLNTLPQSVKTQLIKALINSQQDDGIEEKQDLDPAETKETTNNDSWRNGTLKSSSSAISSTQTNTDSNKTTTHPSHITSSTYEYIDNEHTNANNQPPSAHHDITQKQKQNLDDLAKTLDKHNTC